MPDQDRIEQKARIRNLLADTALKKAQAKTEAAKLWVAFAATGAAIITALCNFFK